jgi:hypothetical protein
VEEERKQEGKEEGGMREGVGIITTVLLAYGGANKRF